MCVCVCVCACLFSGGHYPFGGDVSDDRSFGHTGPSEPEQEYKPHPQRVYTSSITVNPPASFRPIPIQDQGPTPKPAPPAVPPKPFKDTSVFQNVDLHAVEVSLQLVILCNKNLTKGNVDSLCGIANLNKYIVVLYMLL